MEEIQIVDALKNKENVAFRFIYDYYFPSIERYVRANSGTHEDATDVFQETLIVLLKNVPAEDFRFTASVRTYVHAVAANIWRKKLRKSMRLAALPHELQVVDMTLAEWEQREVEIHRKNAIQRIFSKVTRHCMIFLTKTFLNGYTRDQLMQELGYKNYHTFDNQKYKCLEQARKNSGPGG